MTSIQYKGSVTGDVTRIYLSPKQSNIYVWGYQPEARFRTAVCGRRFGKTYLAASEIKRAYRQAVKRKISVDNEIWYGAPTFKQARRVFWGRLKRLFPRSWVKGKPNETDCSITTVTGHVIRIVGLDNYDALRGSGLWFFVGDEWADAKEECWTEVIRPMLSTSGGCALFIGTPKGFNHFYEFYQKGLKDSASAEEGWRSWMYTTLQGGHVPTKEVETAMKELDQRTFDQEYNATFVNFSGRVYYSFLRSENVVSCPYDETKPIHIGMDFNVDPMSATIFQEYKQADGRVLVKQVGEIVMPTSNTHDMCDEIKRRYGRPSFEMGKVDVSHITIYPDPAGHQRRTSAQGKTDISILKEKGFRVVALSSHPLVRDRINIVNAQFCSADGWRGLLVDSACRKSIECYEKLQYKDGTSEPDKDDGYDHIPDATGYYIFARFNATKTSMVHTGHGER